jgi:hypothetical protein
VGSSMSVILVNQYSGVFLGAGYPRLLATHATHPHHHAHPPPPFHTIIFPYAVLYVIVPGTVTRKRVPILWTILTVLLSADTVGRLKNTAPYRPPGTALFGVFIFTVTCASDFGGTVRFFDQAKVIHVEKYSGSPVTFGDFVHLGVPTRLSAVQSSAVK